MITKPVIVQRPAQPFAALRMQVPIPFGQYLGPAWQEVAAWLAGKGLEPNGPPIIRYLTTDMANKLEIEVGFPVETALEGDARITTDTFPAGRYAMLTYWGPYKDNGLMKATAALLDWAREQNITWQTSTQDNVEWWQARLESYVTDPDLEPDPQKWQTDIIFLISDAGRHA